MGEERMIDRRALLATGLATAATPAFAADGLANLEARSGGRLGVYAVDAATGRILKHRADERFAMCSTFKAALAGAVLQRVDRGQERLDQMLPLTRADMRSHEIGRAHV